MKINLDTTRDYFSIEASDGVTINTNVTDDKEGEKSELIITHLRRQIGDDTVWSSDAHFDLDRKNVETLTSVVRWPLTWRRDLTSIQA